MAYSGLPQRRKLPYPFGSLSHKGALLSITSDVDSTNVNRFLFIHQVLNENLNLDIADSVFLLNSNNIKNQIKDFIKKEQTLRSISVENRLLFFLNQYSQGKIDSIHSITEEHKIQILSRYRIKRILKKIRKLGVEIRVWIDHSATPYNFGNTVYTSRQSASGEKHKSGDQKSSFFYHTDLLFNLKYGLIPKFVWHNISPFQFNDVNFNYEHHNKVNKIGSSKYVTRDILIPNVTRDGEKYHQFLRFYFSKETDSSDWVQPNLSNISYQLNKKILNEIAMQGYFSSVATHFGRPIQINDDDIKQLIISLNLLKTFQLEKMILITRTSRMLKYALIDKYLEWRYSQTEMNTDIFIDKINDSTCGVFTPKLEDLRGLTFYVPNPSKTNIYIKVDKKYDLISSEELVMNDYDDYAPSISIKWYEDFAPEFMFKNSFRQSKYKLFQCNGIGSTKEF